MSNLKAGFLITGRLKSTRLPKKVILEVKNRPLIAHMFDRIKEAKRISSIVLCTSVNPQDDPLENIAKEEGVFYYRGSENDVLLRLYEAAVKYGIDYIVNITADCPLVDPLFIDRTVEVYEKTDADLIRFPGLPLGQGPNGIKLSALKEVCDKKDELDTEVWGDYFIKSGLFKYYEAEVEEIYHHSRMKTSIDYAQDYEFIKAVFERLYVPGQIFSLKDILELVKTEPGLIAINCDCAEWGRKHVQDTAAQVRFKPNNGS